jgi:hypothetical protein
MDDKLSEEMMGCDGPGCGKGAGLGDLRVPKNRGVIRLSHAEVERMTLLLDSGPQPFVREIDLRLLIMRLAVWSPEHQGLVEPSEAARERFLLPDGSLNPKVIVVHETGEET